MISYTIRLFQQSADNTLQQLPTNQWFTLDRLNDFDLSDRLIGWLTHVGSMTRLIKSHTDDFHLEVLQADIQTAEASEQILLGLTADSTTYIREVKMSAANEAWLFGRSIFPAELVANDQGAIQSLGETPLGRLLFSQDGQPRLSIEVAFLDSSDPLTKRLNIDGPVFARRSLFRYHNDKVLVQEVFLEEHPIYSV